jgi:hypothetical protein
VYRILILTVKYDILLLLLLSLSCSSSCCALPLTPLPSHLLLHAFASNRLPLLHSLLLAPARPGSPSWPCPASNFMVRFTL